MIFNRFIYLIFLSATSFNLLMAGEVEETRAYIDAHLIDNAEFLAKYTDAGYLYHGGTIEKISFMFGNPYPMTAARKTGYGFYLSPRIPRAAEFAIVGADQKGTIMPIRVKDIPLRVCSSSTLYDTPIGKRLTASGATHAELWQAVSAAADLDVILDKSDNSVVFQKQIGLEGPKSFRELTILLAIRLTVQVKHELLNQKIDLAYQNAYSQLTSEEAKELPTKNQMYEIWAGRLHREWQSTKLKSRKVEVIYNLFDIALYGPHIPLFSQEMIDFLITAKPSQSPQVREGIDRILATAKTRMVGACNVLDFFGSPWKSFFTN